MMDGVGPVPFDEERVWEYAASRSTAVALRLFEVATIASGMWWAWRSTSRAADRQPVVYTTSLTRTRPATGRGRALREGLQDMGVFFVKMGQTLAQRPDIVGDELAEELKGLQEQSAPFDDAVALQIVAEDLGHRGPLAPGIVPAGCDASLPPLFADLDPKHLASASLGQVYRGKLFDGREVALKVQRPGARESIGLDWVVAIFATKAYRILTAGPNDYSMIVDIVAKSICQELDYHHEAANAEEFADRHAFLPFVSSPAVVPECTGPLESTRVLGLRWYPGRALSELNLEERRRLVEMATQACVVQLLITGFVHADPHEGNLRLGDDGRVIFLDFGLMDRVDFAIMECFSAGVRHVLNRDWIEVVKVMQEAQFLPIPLRKFDGGWNSAQVACSLEEFAAALEEQMSVIDGGTSRFGALAIALKKLSAKYLLLTPPYIALICRTFLTLEGLVVKDPEFAETFNIYDVALPFALLRVLSPRTDRGQVVLRDALLEEVGAGKLPEFKWSALASLLEESSGERPSAEEHLGSDSSDLSGDSYGAASAALVRLLSTSDGAALRRILYDVDGLDALRGLLLSKEGQPLRSLLVNQLRAPGRPAATFGQRSNASSAAWNGDRAPSRGRGGIKRSRRAWRLVLRKQFARVFWPPWRFPGRALLIARLLPVSAYLLVRSTLSVPRGRRRKGRAR